MSAGSAQASAASPPGAKRAEWKAGWTVVAAAMAGMSFSAMPTFVPGVVLEPMEHELGWSRAMISSGPMVISLFTIFLSTLAGFVIDRIGARRVAFAALALLIGAMLGMSRIGNDIWAWRGLWALVGLASTAVPSMWLVPVTSRFLAARGLAMAVVLAGPGIGSALSPVVGNYLVEHHGWRSAFLGLAALWSVVAVPLVIFFLRQAVSAPARSGETGLASKADKAETQTGVTARQGFRSANFYKILAAAFCGHAAGVGLIMNLIPVLDWSGLPRATSALIAGSLGLANIAGGVVGGWLLDRYSARILGACASALGLVFPLALLLAPGSVPLTTAALLIYGMLGGTTYPAVTYLTSRHFGTRSFGTLFGTIHAVQVLSVGIAPVLANRAYDLTHSYAPTVMAAIPLMLLAATMFLLLGPYPQAGAPGEGKGHD